MLRIYKMSFRSNDICFGGKKEIEYKTILENCYDCSLVKTTNKYAPYDFYGDNVFIELKSRRIRHTQYPTTVIGYNKLMTAQKNAEKGQFHFVFGFTDGIYALHYNSNKEFLHSLRPRSLSLRRGDSCNVIDIPIEMLNRIH